MTLKTGSGLTGGPRFLVSIKASAIIDAKAVSEWGFNSYSLVESAGQNCAMVFLEAAGHLISTGTKLTAAIGAGNNGADAMAMLRYLILKGNLQASSLSLVLTRMPKNGETGPWVDLLKSFKKLKVPVMVWDGDIGEDAGCASNDIIAQSDIIIDGISGTGINGPLSGKALEMVKAINIHKNSINNSNRKFKNNKLPFVVSIDLPSGNSDEWKPGMPIINADLTLAIEAEKYCNYSPAARPYAGNIILVRGIFPQELIKCYSEAENLDWGAVNKRISKVRPSAYKNQRGSVEVHAGSPGATGAALISSRGAQVVGAGLVRLMADDDIYPILASQAAGIMVIPASLNDSSRPDAILLGPGWGKTKNREAIIEHALSLEKKGIPLIIDADALELVKGRVFNNNVILTPHPGEFSNYSGIDKDELLSNPLSILLKFAREKKAVILFKGHVITIASPDGRVGIVDGMTPALAMGGSGDLLAGFCAGIAARMYREEDNFSAYNCAAAAAGLLIAAGKSSGLKTRFSDPMELASRAADMAGEAWLNS